MSGAGDSNKSKMNCRARAFDLGILQIAGVLGRLAGHDARVRTRDAEGGLV